MTETTGNQPRKRDGSARSDRSERRDGTQGRKPRQTGRSDAGRSSDSRGGRRDRASQGRPERRGDREVEVTPPHNPADLRSANRPDRGRSPNIDEDVTGRELDKSVQRQLGALDEHNRPWVQKHLVMAGRLIDEDPELAFDHALAASRRGGRLAVVREAAGMAAYAAGKFTEALREFRTYRRISGDNAHLPEMVDAERALGRTDKALEMAAEANLDQLPVTSRVELAIVVSGIHLDQQAPQAAVKVLEIPQLNPRRGFRIHRACSKRTQMPCQQLDELTKRRSGPILPDVQNVLWASMWNLNPKSLTSTKQKISPREFAHAMSSHLSNTSATKTLKVANSSSCRRFTTL